MADAKLSLSARARGFLDWFNNLRHENYGCGWFKMDKDSAREMSALFSQLLAERDRMRKLVRKVYYRDRNGYCPCCGVYAVTDFCKPDCELAALLKEKEKGEGGYENERLLCVAVHSDDCA